MTEFTKFIDQMDKIEQNLIEMESYESEIEKLANYARCLDESTENLTGSLASEMAKFQKRCTDIDPVTGQTRYGENMKKKVGERYKQYEKLLNRCNKLRVNMDIAVKHAKARQIEAEEDARREEQKNKILSERQHALSAEKARMQALEEEKMKEIAEQEEEILNQEAERIRKMKKHMEEEERLHMEEEYKRKKEEDEGLMASVAVGVAGIDSSLPLLFQSCQEDAKVYKSAVDLLTLYVGNVIAHPEEAAYKRIRRSNPTFFSKVGQYHGGVQCLLAAGFRIVRDEEHEVVFVMEEPSFEKDNKAWTQWYDNVKDVRDRLNEESDRIRKLL